ncbi:MAG: CdaR family protein [bacterium]
MTDALKKFFFNNWQYKLGSILVALILWFYLASEQNLSVVVSAPVQFDNFPADMQIVNKVSNTVDLGLTGRRDIVNNINKKEMIIIINLKESHEGKNNYRITPLNIKFMPRGLDIKNITPYQIEIELKKSKSQKVAV